MISVFVAASGRPKMLRAMLESLSDTTGKYDVEVVAAIDNDMEGAEIASSFGVKVLYEKKRRGALKAWNDAFSKTKGSILVPAGDDQLFYEGWLDYALESHEKRLGGYGVVGMNDLAYNGNTQVATMFLFDRKYCKEVMGGIFAPPCYRYLCVDLEWNEKAKILGKFFWDERSVVEHLHSAHGKREYDSHDKWKDESGLYEVDTETLEGRKSRGFPVEWESLI